jgi:hypothetical protein
MNGQHVDRVGGRVPMHLINVKECNHGVLHLEIHVARQSAIPRRPHVTRSTRYGLPVEVRRRTDLGHLARFESGDLRCVACQLHGIDFHILVERRRLPTCFDEMTGMPWNALDNTQYTKPNNCERSAVACADETTGAGVDAVVLRSLATDVAVIDALHKFPVVTSVHEPKQKRMVSQRLVHGAAHSTENVNHFCRVTTIFNS